jgi:N-acylneuraminate cytidylyltransferase
MNGLCIIPARGGSKRIPRKNIRDFCGKPMIAWSIEAAKQSNCFDRIVVSTDDKEIADISLSLGAEIPFMRPEELADDRTGITPVVAHAVQWLLGEGDMPEAVCCLYATAPFVQAAELRQGRELLTQIESEQFVFTATSYASPIQRALRLDPLSGEAHMWQPEHFNKRSQDLEVAYHDAGQFYWGRAQAWLAVSNLFEGGRPLLLPRWRVQDIDTPDDWHRAELMHQASIST